MNIAESQLVKMHEVLDMNEYEAAVEAGYIKKVKHPEHDLWILNYTDKCTWDQAWDSATLNCRGMIVNQDGEIVSRGMPKFFNSDQEQAPKLELDTKVRVTDKMDGSLGILYQLPDEGWAISTRGSFASDQAIWATNFLNSDKELLSKLAYQHSRNNYTALFEIIYPENRIVVDYGDYEGLVHLQVLDNRTGKRANKFGPFWGFSNADIVDAPKTWGEVLSRPDRSNAEGYVIENIETGDLVKVKYEEYKRLHKFMTRVTARHVWECLRDGRNFVTEFEGAPDEFQAWVKEVAWQLREVMYVKFTEVVIDYNLLRRKVESKLGKNYSRKEFAEEVKASSYEDKPSIFLMADSKLMEIQCRIYKTMKPDAFSYKSVSSDSD